MRLIGYMMLRLNNWNKKLNIVLIDSLKTEYKQE